MNKEISDALDELFSYVDLNTIKSFTHQIMRGNHLNAEFQLTRRGFEFYAGYGKNILQCQFDKDEVWTCDVSQSSVSDALVFLKDKIRSYMISKSIWKF